VDADELAGRTELTLEAVDRAGNVGDTIRVVEVAEDEALEENEQEEATSPEDAGQAQPVPGLGLVGAIAAGFVAARLYRR
jgi:flagellar biosynthesis/type III secretory pathway M-ring protein FliF/YscJ